MVLDGGPKFRQMAHETVFLKIMRDLNPYTSLR